MSLRYLDAHVLNWEVEWSRGKERFTAATYPFTPDFLSYQRISPAGTHAELILNQRCVNVMTLNQCWFYADINANVGTFWSLWDNKWLGPTLLADAFQTRIFGLMVFIECPNTFVDCILFQITETDYIGNTMRQFACFAHLQKIYYSQTAGSRVLDPNIRFEPGLFSNKYCNTRSVVT